MSDELPPLAQTPLMDLLRGVPVDAVMSYEHSPTSHQNIPVGRLCAAAVEEMLDLEKEAAIARSAGEQLLARVDIEAKRAQSAEAERDALLDECKALRQWRDDAVMMCAKRRCAQRDADLAEVEAERDALRQDAERYRLLRGWIDAARSAKP